MNSIEQLSNWENIIALQFENVVFNNLQKVCELLGVDGFEMAGPYFQRTTKRQRGCQIDLMIQTKFNILYICEIKFCRHEVTTKVIQDVTEKMERLNDPKGYSLHPVLIHVNGVTDHVVRKNFFSQIIDFSEMLHSK